MRMSAPENRNPDLSTVSPQHQVCTLETSTSDLGPQGTFFMPERWLWIVPRGRRRGTDDRVPAVAEGMSADHQGAQSQSQPRLVLGFRVTGSRNFYCWLWEIENKQSFFQPSLTRFKLWGPGLRKPAPKNTVDRDLFSLTNV